MTYPRAHLLVDLRPGHIMHHHTVCRTLTECLTQPKKITFMLSYFVHQTRSLVIGPTDSHRQPHVYLSYCQLGSPTFRVAYFFSSLSTSASGTSKGWSTKWSKDCCPFGNVEQSPPQYKSKV